MCLLANFSTPLRWYKVEHSNVLEQVLWHRLSLKNSQHNSMALDICKKKPCQTSSEEKQNIHVGTKKGVGI